MKNIAIITGSSRGLGAAMAESLAKEGYKIVLNYRRDASRKLAEDLCCRLKETYGAEVMALQADVSIYEDCERLINEAIDRFGGKIDVLINNAGITNNVNFLDITREQYETVIQTNLFSMFHMVHIALPYMIDHSSNIINISSVGGLIGIINQADYCAAKAGVIGFTKALALEYADRKVRVNAIAPGMMETDMLKRVNQEELFALKKLIPLGRFGDAEDIAHAVEYIIHADYLTGQVISPNGGFVMNN